MPKAENNNQPASLRELYPELSDEELEIAEETLTRYVKVTVKLYEAICADPARKDALRKRIEEEREPDSRVA